MATIDPSIHELLFGPGNSCCGRGPLFRRLWQIGSAALDLLYPPHCISCNAPLPAQIESVLCMECVKDIRWIGADRCKRCGDMVGIGSGAVETCVSCKQVPPRFVEAASCAVRYVSGPARDALLGLKFGRRAFAAKALGRALARRIQQTGLLEAAANPIVVPAPLTPAAMLKRGYNQAGELALWVSNELNLRFEPRILKKIRMTMPQAGLSEKRRRENLVGAFECPRKWARKLAGANVLLIDDVITTGSTISECARTLHEAGIGTVVAASFARG